MATKLTKKEKEQLQKESTHNAKVALIGSIIGFLWLGIILEPLALYYSIKARETLRNIESTDGRTWAVATTALVFSSIGVGLFAFAILCGAMIGLWGL